MHHVPVHICLVSDQMAANLVPLLSPQRAPQEIELLVTPQQRNAAYHLSAVLEARGLIVRHHEIVSSSWHTVYEAVFSIARALPQGAVALNVTGGTKIMALAALQAIRDCGQQAYYLQNDTGELITVEPWSLESEKITSTLTLEEYVSAYGCEPEGPFERPDCHEYKTLFRELLHVAPSKRQCISELNALAARASQNNKWTVPYGFGGWQGIRQNTKELLSLFKNHGILKCRQDDIVFNGRAGAQMVRGGWLELAVYQILKGFAQDAACNVKINLNSSSQEGKVSNEYDVVALINNHLYFVECKTSKTDKDTKSRDIVYKQIAVSKSISNMSNCSIVSVCPLGAANVKRATEQGCLVIEESNLSRLEELLEKWAGKQ